ncbi:acyl-CoA dehydrogenase family protein [Marinomonas sp. TI.3.20]|uniref:acyl-CoA dehydrogenase family protein n=1 Tax=Marinomonas sp. TI.3.20 TaxID=3121296 RepID=UPI00311D2CED
MKIESNDNDKDIVVLTKTLSNLFYKSPPNYSEIIDFVISYLDNGEYIDILNVFFQISGVLLPLSISVDNSKKYQTSWLEKLKTGSIFGAHCMTEVQGGTDIFSMKTTAIEFDKYWLINGQKTLICNAHNSEVGLLYTNFNTTFNPPYNLCAFILDLKLNGISISSPIKTIGLDGINLGSIYLNDVRLPKDAILGCIGEGQNIAYISTTLERLLIPIVFIAKLYQFYKSSPQSLKADFFRIYIANRLFVEKILSSIDLFSWNREYIKLGCLLKWHVSDEYIKAAKLTGDERHYLDSLSSWIYSGNNDSLKNMVSRLV